VLEIAIGEGTLSARVFGNRAQVTGLDLNPHSLVKAARLEHVDRAVVADGLHPPVRSGSFDLVLSMNFLHHVTDKRGTVREWARIAPALLFNENTVYWASGWPGPYLLRRIGLSGLADRHARRIEQRSLQRLMERSALDGEVAAVARVREKVSFLSERSFFLCGLFSSLMLCYGPPTPAILKRAFLGPLRFVAFPLSRTLARLLLRFDAGENRAADTFVFYACEGDGSAAVERGRELVCPRCASDLDGARCTSCGAIYPQADGMLFLLPPQFASVFDEYARREGAPIRADHL
jgi:SAM-dependent methyltransferase